MCVRVCLYVVCACIYMYVGGCKCLQRWTYIRKITMKLWTHTNHGRPRLWENLQSVANRIGMHVKKVPNMDLYRGLGIVHVVRTHSHTHTHTHTHTNSMVIRENYVHGWVWNSWRKKVHDWRSVGGGYVLAGEPLHVNTGALKVHRNQKQLKFAFILVLGNFSHSFRFLHYFLFILTK